MTRRELETTDAISCLSRGSAQSLLTCSEPTSAADVTWRAIMDTRDATGGRRIRRDMSVRSIGPAVVLAR